MTDKHYNSDDFNTEQSEEVRSLVLLSGLVHQFAASVFPSVSEAYFQNGNQGLKAEFGKVSLLADGFGGRMMVTLNEAETNTMITFGSCTELPFGRFHAPSLMSYHGTLADWKRVVRAVGDDLYKANSEGRSPFANYPVLANMLGVR